MLNVLWQLGELYPMIKTIVSERVTKNILLTLHKHLQKPVTFSCIQNKMLGSFNKYSPILPLMAILFPEGKESDS